MTSNLSMSFRLNNIDATQAGTSIIFTTSSMNFRLQNIIFDVTSLSNMKLEPYISIGISGPTYTDLFPIMNLSSNVSNTYQMFTLSGGIYPDIPENSNVVLNIQYPSKADTYIMNVTLVGFYDN